MSWLWAHSADGLTLDAHGTGLPVTPEANKVCVLVVPAEKLSWHRVRLPRTPTGKLSAVLAGLLEEQLLDDPAELHFSLEPGLNPGRSAVNGWVAVCDKGWLCIQIDTLVQQGWKVTRILPAFTPRSAPLMAAQQHGETCQLTVSGPHGVMVMPLSPSTLGNAGGASAFIQWLKSTALTHPQVSDLYLTTPGASATVEAMIPGLPWIIQPTQAAWLSVMNSKWDLAQGEFRLSDRVRRQRAWQEGLASLWNAPAWRPMRWGLAALLLVHVAGLNAVAWQERSRLAALQQATRDTLTQTFPEVTLVIDAPLQMQRELERLRRARGQTEDADLEPLLQQLGRLSLQTPLQLQQIDYRQDGSVRLSHAALAPPDETALRQQLERAGWQVQALAGQTQLVRGRQP